MPLTRRQFLGLAGGAAVTGTAGWAALIRDHASSTTGSSASSDGAPGILGHPDNVLVVVQLSGGNDALNTVVPHIGTYHDLRPDLGIADADLVALSGETSVGLHPSLGPLRDLWDAHHLGIVTDIGFADDSRSHFESLAAWWAADPKHQQAGGWLGRWLDATQPPDATPLVAVALGGGAAPALRAQRARSTAINDLQSFALNAPGAKRAGSNAMADAFLATSAPASTDPLLAASQAAVAGAVEATKVLAKVSASGSAAAPVEGDDPEQYKGAVTEGLSAAAKLLELDLGTRVVLVSASGFDTHAGQADTQQRLLGDVAGGLKAFYAQLAGTGRAERVLTITTSEFGRRAQQNGSGGTDHGHGGAHFVVGPMAAGGLHGSVDVAKLADGDLQCATDTRSLYAAALDWLGGPTDEILGGSYDRMGLVA
ncbi:MAG: DUF1501 domain-containing protein [Acidimicrobiales bacterium]